MQSIYCGMQNVRSVVCFFFLNSQESAFLLALSPLRTLKSRHLKSKQNVWECRANDRTSRKDLVRLRDCAAHKERRYKLIALIIVELFINDESTPHSRTAVFVPLDRRQTCAPGGLLKLCVCVMMDIALVTVPPAHLNRAPHFIFHSTTANFHSVSDEFSAFPGVLWWNESIHAGNVYICNFLLLFLSLTVWNVYYTTFGNQMQQSEKILDSYPDSDRVSPLFEMNGYILY